MSEKWMPGPWEVDAQTTCPSIRRSGDIEAGGRWRVATVGSSGMDKKDDRCVATAHLISAAPELYAVVAELEESVEYWSEYFVPLGIVDRMRLALKKARGEV